MLHHMPGNSRCVFCGFHWADFNHAIIFCQVVKYAWKDTEWWPIIKRTRSSHLIDLFPLFNFLLNQQDLERLCMKMWGVWKDRCSFAHKPSFPARTSSKPISALWTYSFLDSFCNAIQILAQRSQPLTKKYSLITTCTTPLIFP